ncbi:MAG: quaternary ammonium compound efflux SMR transporter SugE [Ottowia sp.]|nr:quaternary ammonium compound efflux SMR transporter SugE [Ottowia sp.]
MPWILLFVAGLFEIGWAIGLKYTHGFTRLWPSVGTALSMLVSVVLLGLAMRDQPVDTAYAVWTGIGAVGTVILGIALFNDPANAARLVCVGLIVAGILGLKLTSV